MVAEKIQISSDLNAKFESVVNEICSTFGLTREELTQVVRIQSVEKLDSWIHTEEEPEKAVRDRLYDLIMVSRAWSTYRFGADRELLFHPVIDDQSIFDLLGKSNIDQEYILFAASKLDLILPGRGNLLNP